VKHLETDSKKTQKLSPLGADDFADLEREVKELESRETQRIAARKEAVEKALSSTADCSSSVDPVGCKKAHSQIAWRASQDKYERAALTDIVNEDHDKDDRDVADVAMTQTRAEELHNQRTAEKLSGIKEFNALDKQSMGLEKIRSAKEQAALKALISEKHQLAQVKEEEMEERDKADQRQQARKSAEIQKEVNIHVSQEMFDHTKSDATASTATLTNAAAAGIAQAESSSMSALAGPSQHDIEVKEAARIEQQRQAFFEKQIAAMKKADLKVRRQRATHADAAVTARVPKKQGLHLAQYERDEREAMAHSRSRSHARARAASAAPARHVTPTGDVESEYKSLGLAPEGNLAHVMSDDYRADVTLASIEDTRRQQALEAHIEQERALEGKKAARQQHAANQMAEASLTAQNVAAGYSKPTTDFLAILNTVPHSHHVFTAKEADGDAEAAAARHHDAIRAAHLDTMENAEKLGSEIVNQFDIEKTPSQQAITNKVIQSREAEINEIFQPGT